MNRKHRLFGWLLLSALFLSVPFAAGAEDSAYDACNITIQPGSNEKELSFTWFTTIEPTETTELVIYDASELATHYAGTCETVEVEEESGGPGSGPPPGASAATDETDDDAEEEDATIYSCKVTAVSVEESSQYSYVVGDGGIYSDINYFETQDEQSYNFIFIGDPQIGASRDTESDSAGWAETVTQALTAFPETSFILSAGDQVESATSATQYDGFFSAEQLASVPFAPAIGNHDTSDLYAYHFNVPNESELGTTDGGGDYWFTYGSTLFMVLNTNNSSALSHSEFMTEAIEANPDVKWKVVVFHHSIYSSARHVDDVNDLRVSMYPVMDEQDIDVVLAGHDHFYARTYQLSDGDVVAAETQKIIGKSMVVDPDGVVYFTANSASGSKYYDYTYIEGYTNLYFAKYEQLETPTYLNVDVTSSSLTVSAYRTDTGETLDTYTITKKRQGRHAYE